MSTHKHAIKIRPGTKNDVAIIASIHAMSWMKTYRGLLSDAYLDNDLLQERSDYWRAKMELLTKREFVLIAMLGDEPVGFICVLDRARNGYDAFIDNLHVRGDLKGFGIGTTLMQHAAALLSKSGRISFYLWVLEGNTAAEKFYTSRGAEITDSCSVIFGGKEVMQSRFGWAQWQFTQP